MQLQLKIEYMVAITTHENEPIYEEQAKIMSLSTVAST